MFTQGLVRDLIETGWELELGLVDIDPEALLVVEKLSSKMIEARGRSSQIRLRASTDRRELLPQATVVICTIGVGGRRTWEQDVFIPRKYGIYQPVGDTVMPGGSSRALRMIPPMVDIATDILDLAPDALFFNYGNPMACICRGVKKATGADIVGLCHGVNSVAGYLAEQLGIAKDRVSYTAVGINHLTWFTDLKVDGLDAMPSLQEIAGQRTTEDDNPFSWHLFRVFGAFPAVLDRHVCEFFPQFFADGNYYGRKLGIDAFSFEKTIEWGDQIYEQMKEDALSPRPLSQRYFDRIAGEHEQVVEIIDSIRSNACCVYSANLPNHGQVPNLPGEAIVECPALAGAFGIRPVMVEPLSPSIAGTLATRFMWVETIVEAALEGSRDKFIQALVLDGAVKSLEIAEQLADELLHAQRAYLPQFQSSL